MITVEALAFKRYCPRNAKLDEGHSPARHCPCAEIAAWLGFQALCLLTFSYQTFRHLKTDDN